MGPCNVTGCASDNQQPGYLDDTVFVAKLFKKEARN